MKGLLPSFRPFAPPDLDPLVDCWFDTWHTTFAPVRHPRPRHAWRARFLDEYANEAETWLTPSAEQVAAFMVLFPRQGWIEQLFVHPRFQGRGLGRSLIALARLRCPDGLALDTPAENIHAREFYRRRGFVAQKVGFDPLLERVILRYAWPAPMTVSDRRDQQ